ncbi:MAG: 50S ribosomal protein L11 methyltransferase, partial [Methylomonas sp.]
MAWHQVSVITNELTAPELADVFSDLGAVSVTFMDAEDEPVYEPGIGETKIWSRTQVVALYELEAEPELIKTLVIQRFDPILLNSWHYEPVADQAWERAWMEHFKPMKFADRLWVCPTGQEQHEAGSVCLI